MRALPPPLRKQLETSVLAARRAAESASRAVIEGLSVFQREKPAHLDAHQAALRVGLRQKWRQLGGDEAAKPLLVGECAFEQWHRLLFARFLAENDLLLHPQYKAPVTLGDCDELAAELGEPDGWSVAARFAAEILPGIFRLDDPSVRLRLAPEGRHALEQILDGLSSDVFKADDALGWVYQFWQKDKKDEVNASERKVGGADIGPVTQLFTENYMVRFLLENSLGAWWAARHPESPLIKEFDYLRFDDKGKPAAGTFDGWPDRVANVTVMDPCCGSGHFLVEAFAMLWQMRSEEEGLPPVNAQDAVLRDNLFGLEIDPRCVQIAMFAVALHAWKSGGGWRALPVPNIACSGVPVKALVNEWKDVGGGDRRLENALVRLHILFREADSLGSLIDPRRAVEIVDPTGLQASLEDVEWEEVAPLLDAMGGAEPDDPAVTVLGAQAAGLARVAGLLARQYTLVVTNVPYLQKAKQSDQLRQWAEAAYPDSREDLATLFVSRCLRLIQAGGTESLVTSRYWFFLGRYRALRERILTTCALDWFVELGAGAFQGISGEVVNAALVTITRSQPMHPSWGLDVTKVHPASAKAEAVRAEAVVPIVQEALLANPDARIRVEDLSGGGHLLSEFAEALGGITTGDSARFRRCFWKWIRVVLFGNSSRRPRTVVRSTAAASMSSGGSLVRGHS